MAELQIDSRVISGVPTLCLTGELDSYSASRVRSILDTMTEIQNPTVLIDMKSLDYIDSAGLGVLVAALKQAVDNNGAMALSGLTPPIARVMRVTGLDKLFTVFENESEALLTLSKSAHK